MLDYVDEMVHFIDLCNKEAEWIDGNEHRGSKMLHEGSTSAFVFVFFAQFFSGIGIWLFASLGGPYTENVMLLPHEIPVIYGIIHQSVFGLQY